MKLTKSVALTIQVDASNPKQPESALVQTHLTFERLDFAVNNAGIDMEIEPSEESRDRSKSELTRRLP